MKTPVLEPPEAKEIVGLWVTPPGQQPRMVAFADMGFPADKASVVVGKGRDCDLSVESDSNASTFHFALEASEDEVWIKDLGSTNGTHINGVRLCEPYKLAPEMLISFGLSSAVVVGTEFKVPLRASTLESFYEQAGHAHGSTRAAADAIGVSHTTVHRAMQRRKKKKNEG